VIEVKGAGQLERRGLCRITPVAALLVLGEKLDRHPSSSRSASAPAEQTDRLSPTVFDGGKALLPYTKSVEKKGAGTVCRTTASGQTSLRRVTMIYASMRVSTPQQTLENQH